MIDRVLKLATGARAAVALGALGFVGIPLFRASPYDAVKALLGGASLPEETITSPARFAEILEVLGAAGRELYLKFQVWDLLNPILIGVAGAMLLGWLLQRSRRAKSAWRFVVLLPFAALCTDLAENLIISIAVGAFPDIGVVANVLPLVTAAKFGAVVATMISACLLGLLWTRDRLSGVRRPAT